MATTVRRVTTRPYAVPEACGGGGGGRVTLEPGTVTVVPVYSVHNDRRYFDDPETFRPHRFPEQLSSAYMPHGSGPRSYISKGPFLSHPVSDLRLRPTIPTTRHPGVRYGLRARPCSGRFGSWSESRGDPTPNLKRRVPPRLPDADQIPPRRTGYQSREVGGGIYGSRV